MKLAEALIERSNLQTEIETIRMRMVNNAKIQEGQTANEDPNKLLVELEEKLARLEYLVVHINKTNGETMANEKQTIAELIAKKDCLSKQLSITNSLYTAGSELVSRLTHSEIKIVSSFDVSKVHSKIDSISKELRVVETKIQECNWLTELK